LIYLISLIFFCKKPRFPAEFLISRNFSNAPARRRSDLKKTLIYIRDREPPVSFGKNKARAQRTLPLAFACAFLTVQQCQRANRLNVFLMVSKCNEKIMVKRRKIGCADSGDRIKTIQLSRD